MMRWYAWLLVMPYCIAAAWPMAKFVTEFWKEATRAD